MLDISIYQAECGNAARIRYEGTDGQIHNVFVDAGVERTYKHVLEKEISRMISAKEVIDLFVVSHIHDDHIGGTISYLKAINKKLITDNVKLWFYNPPRFSKSIGTTTNPGTTASRSIGQGDQLLKYLTTNNRIQKGDITDELPEFDLHGLKIKILSPSLEKLTALRTKYSGSRTFETREAVSRAIKKYDYDTLLDDFDLEKWKEDDSIENGSSIAFITEFSGSKMLWLADAHPSVIVDSLRKMGFSESNPLICDWVKVTHHGSKANNSNDLYDLIKCNNYIMSVNGENNHCLPTKECFARILRNENRPDNTHYHFYFTYDNPTLRRIFEKDGNSVFEKFSFALHFLSDDKWISISNS